jgi:hypothetical protein
VLEIQGETVPNTYRILEERADGKTLLVGEFSSIAAVLASLDRAVEGSRSRFFVTIAASNKVLFRTQGSHFESSRLASAAR